MRILGHPLHAMLVALPLGVLVLVPLWDGLAWLGWLSAGSVVAQYSELAGLLAGIVALITGVAELILLRSQAQLLQRAGLHGLLGGSALAVFAFAFVLRGDAATLPSVGVLALEAFGALLLTATGWLGGELVFAHGVGQRSQSPKDDQRRQQRAPVL